MKKYLFFLGVWFLNGYTLLFAASGGGILIRLPEKATVVGPRVNLGEVVNAIGSNKAILDRIRRVDLGRAAIAGKTIKITQGFIKVTIRREGYSTNDFVFDGSQSVEVLTQSREISTKDLLPEAKSFILGKLKESTENVRVSLAGAEKKIILPVGEMKTTFRPPLSGKYEGSFLLATELEVNGRLDRVLPLRVTVEVLHSVVVTVRKIEKGEKFTTENTALIRMPTSKIPPETLHQLENVLGRTAALPLVPETALRITYLYDPPVIKRGKKVLAIVQRGNVEMTVDVRAIEDGKAGDSIRVENTVTHKALRARVRDEKTVLIEDEKP